MDADLRQTIEELIDCGAVRFDVERNPDTKMNFLRIWSTRELLTDEIRDRLLLNWRDTLSSLSELLDDGRIDFETIEGLCVKQSDRGFDAHDLSFDEHRGAVAGSYRW